jgi:hypothetical protein
MKERPILYSGEMVRATLEDRKTKTRRIIMLRDFRPCDNVPGSDWYFRSKNGIWSDVSTELLIEKYCPFGKPGDRLWVRETWGIGALDIAPSPAAWIAYKADGVELPIDYKKDCKRIRLTSVPDIGHHSSKKWRPSIFMPRWASRITLEITNVRVERVQDISETDAENEGIHLLGLPENERHNHPRKHIVAFQKLWDSIYAKRGYGWNSNPWVWVIEFRLLEKNHG